MFRFRVVDTTTKSYPGRRPSMVWSGALSCHLNNHWPMGAHAWQKPHPHKRFVPEEQTKSKGVKKEKSWLHIQAPVGRVQSNKAPPWIKQILWVLWVAGWCPDGSSPSMTHRCSKGLGSGRRLHLVFSFSGQSWAVFVVWRGALSCWESAALRGCTWYSAVFGWVVRVKASTQSFPEEHCLVMRQTFSPPQMLNVFNVLLMLVPISSPSLIFIQTHTGT